MLSKNTVKFIKSLQQKKFRKQENAFFVEGAKNVTELLHSNFECTHLLFTEKYDQEFTSLVASFSGTKIRTSREALATLGTFTSNDQALAVAKIKPNGCINVVKGELALALDDIRDPGNLGTIIRIADWYGIKKLILSQQTADIYNPKVLHASMGSFTRVDFQYVELKAYLTDSHVPVFGAFLDGENIHTLKESPAGILLVGNESQGISPDLIPFITKKVTIPSYGAAESLNAAIATAVLCDNFRRL
ncbi:MAG: RNA methyltransferase [Cyclobacteriaceae bacterium]